MYNFSKQMVLGNIEYEIKCFFFAQKGMNQATLTSKLLGYKNKLKYKIQYNMKVFFNYFFLK